MNDLYRALGDISSIRKQVASTTEFRGYGPATLAATGALALLAALVQQRFVPDPVTNLSAYLAIWITTAVVCCALCAGGDDLVILRSLFGMLFRRAHIHQEAMPR